MSIRGRFRRWREDRHLDLLVRESRLREAIFHYRQNIAQYYKMVHGAPLNELEGLSRQIEGAEQLVQNHEYRLRQIQYKLGRGRPTVVAAA